MKTPMNTITHNQAREVVRAIENDAARDENWEYELKQSLLLGALTYLSPSQLRELMQDTIDPADERNACYYASNGETVTALIKKLPKQKIS